MRCMTLKHDSQESVQFNRYAIGYLRAIITHCTTWKPSLCASIAPKAQPTVLRLDRASSVIPHDNHKLSHTSETNRGRQTIDPILLPSSKASAPAQHILVDLHRATIDLRLHQDNHPQSNLASVMNQWRTVQPSCPSRPFTILIRRVEPANPSCDDIPCSQRRFQIFAHLPTAADRM